MHLLDPTATLGIDIKNHHVKKTQRREAASRNPYLLLLVKLYKFLTRRTDSGFNKVVLQRLVKSKIYKPPVSLSKLSVSMKGREDKIAVVVGPITDDNRFHEVPKLTVAALRFTESARARIVKAGVGSPCPTGANTVLLRGSRQRVALKHFGKAPGTPGSTARPYIRSKGRKFERARGRRASRGYRN
ncbi:60S ribosomal protein L18-B [Catenaria anguillulae PL171]|uniref:60S ribosomal protein L18-B n=1 Tax=Catenaria anguillulae PL171 TaxID=765915 RepID=A0A1Y2HZK4_9FUNG|nr:60S ribosomal protein L18-B [Catenaria anguillulae PL171]